MWKVDFKLIKDQSSWKQRARILEKFLYYAYKIDARSASEFLLTFFSLLVNK